MDKSCDGPFLCHALLLCLLVVPCVSQSVPSCAVNCSVAFVDQWSKAVDRSGEATDSGSIPNLQRVFNFVVTRSEINDSMNSLSAVCVVYTDYNACLERCSDTDTSLIRQGLETIRYICDDQLQSFKENLPCLSKHDLEIRQRCRDFLQRLHTLRPFLRGFDNMPLTLKPYLLEEYCKYGLVTGVDMSVHRNTLSHIECTVPAVTDACGEGAADLVTHVLHKSLLDAERLINSTENLIPEIDECDLLMNKTREMTREFTTTTTTTSTSTESPTTTTMLAGAEPEIVFPQDREASNSAGFFVANSVCLIVAWLVCRLAAMA